MAVDGVPLRCGGLVSTKVDIYSFGMTILEVSSNFDPSYPVNGILKSALSCLHTKYRIVISRKTLK